MYTHFISFEMIILRFRCDGKSSCSAFANATDFPNEVDPCPSTVKYLEAQFYCMKLKVTQQPPSPSSEATNSGKHYLQHIVEL